MTILRRSLFPILLVVGISASPVRGFGAAGDPQSLIDNLKDDDKPYNATTSAESLVAMAASMPPEAIRILEKDLESADLQLHQFAAAVLTQVYDKQGIKPQAWPKAFLNVVVEGLRDDEIYWPMTFQNHRMFFNYLYFLEEGFPLALIQAELKGNDPQSRFGAAVLLAHHLRGTVQPDVGSLLLEHLKDDDQVANGRAAFQALAELGSPTFERITTQLKVADWQQAAYLQCIAAYLNSPWAAPEDFLEEWYQRATGAQGNSEIRLEIPALYLHPKAARFLQGREIPALLSRIQKGGVSLRTSHDRAVWLGTWFWYIKPRPTLNPYFAKKPYIRYSEFRLDMDGDYFIALQAIAGIRH